MRAVADNLRALVSLSDLRLSGVSVRVDAARHDDVALTLLPGADYGVRFP